MEHTNLVVTPDGKTWDEVTRDVSYIGDITWSAGTDGDLNVTSGYGVFNEYRGSGMATTRHYYQKDFAIAYDRHICLRTGSYSFTVRSMTGASSQSGGMWLAVTINGVDTHGGYLVDADHYSPTVSFDLDMKRGDYFQIKGYLRDGIWGNYEVKRVN